MNGQADCTEFYNGISFDNKKQKSIDLCYNMNRPWKYHAKCKKPNHKDHILCNLIYKN